MLGLHIKGFIFFPAGIIVEKKKNHLTATNFKMDFF